MTDLESIVYFCDELLSTREVPDYGGAVNGLQVAATPGRTIGTVACAVDASEAVLHDAVRAGADLLVVHHGLFWGGGTPVTGPLYRKLRLLLRHDMAVYASHLPLDGHPEIGNGVLLAGAIGVSGRTPFGDFKGFRVGCMGTVDPCPPEALARRISAAVGGGPVRHISGGPERVASLAVVTGGGGGMIPEAAAAGVDALVTGEGAHHTFAQAHELGIHVFYAGHYATETFGVKALGRRLADHFGVEWIFLDHPSGL